ncbi:hypothetical protein ACOSP7_013276 [Xanthoceras sorbifolium]
MMEFKKSNNSLRKENDSLKLAELRKKKTERENLMRMEELKKWVAKLLANEDRLQTEHKAEMDNLVEQMGALMEKVETIASDAVVKTKAELMKEYIEGRVDYWRLEGDIIAWEELKALAVAEEAEVSVSGGDGAWVPSSVDDATNEWAETGQGKEQEGDGQQQQ